MSKRYTATCSAEFEFEFRDDGRGDLVAQAADLAVQELATAKIKVLHIEPNREDFPDVVRKSAEEEAAEAAAAR